MSLAAAAVQPTVPCSEPQPQILQAQQSWDEYNGSRNGMPLMLEVLVHVVRGARIRLRTHLTGRAPFPVAEGVLVGSLVAVDGLHELCLLLQVAPHLGLCSRI